MQCRTLHAKASKELVLDSLFLIPICNFNLAMQMVISDSLKDVMNTAVSEYRALTAGGRHRNWRSLDLQLTDSAIQQYELQFASKR